MSILSNIQAALLDSIIKQTRELTAAIEENRESDVSRLYMFRSNNLSILSELKCIKNFEARFAAYC